VVDYTFEADMKEVVLKTNFVGFVPEIKVPLENGGINYTFGGSRSTQKSQKSSEKPLYAKQESTLYSKTNAGIKINYIGTYNSNGVPIT